MTPELDRAAAAIRLWWLTQKHEDMGDIIAFDLAKCALAAAARQGGDVQQAPAESPQSGGDSRNAQGPSHD